MQKTIFNFEDSPYSDEMKGLASKILSQETGKYVIILSLSHITQETFMEKIGDHILDMYNDMKMAKSKFFQYSFTGDEEKVEKIFVQIFSDKAAIYYT